MESDNKFENDTGGMSVDEIIADIDRKTANAEALEENSVGVTPVPSTLGSSDCE